MWFSVEHLTGVSRALSSVPRTSWYGSRKFEQKREVSWNGLDITLRASSLRVSGVLPPEASVGPRQVRGSG